MSYDRWDAIIIGGGPAGLSAALLLGRCLRDVLIVDACRPRNRFAHRMHGFLTRDGADPDQFLRTAREQLQRYETVRYLCSEADGVRIADGEFVVRLQSGEVHQAPALLLATGVVDCLPGLDGIDRFYGHSVHHCPYCDGYEWRDRRIAAYGRGDAKGAGLALLLRQWSREVRLFTDGPAELSIDMRERLTRQGIGIEERPILRLTGHDSALQSIVLEGDHAVERDALFFNSDQHQCSPLAETLGCRFTERGGVDTGHHDVSTGITGLYVAGDVTRDVQLVAVAAAEGVKAAFAIHKVLLKRDGLL